MMFDRRKLQDDLLRDEALKTKPYKCTEGKLTIGVGRNLDERGITRDEALYLFNNDLAMVEAEMRLRMPWADRLSEPRQRALANMLFNIGWPRLSGFAKMIEALKSNDFATAAREALDSQWARQVGDRAKRVAEMIRVG